MNCLSAQDVLEFRIGCEPVEICCPCAEIEELLEIAYEMVKCITGYEWCPVKDCKTFEGSGSDTLFFNSVTTQPLQEIISICHESCCGCPETLEQDLIRNHGHYLEYPCGCFPCGKINVVGYWGRAMPAGIKRALILLTLELIEPGSSGMGRNGDVKSATWEDFRITYSNTETEPGTLTTGFTDIDDILVMYTNTANDIHFAVVPEAEQCLPRDCGIVYKPKCCGANKCQKC